jgi:methyl-accepting chemotaxis protein
MNIHIHIHHHYPGENAILKQLFSLNNKIDHFMSNTSQTLDQIVQQITKAKGEIVAKIQELTDAVTNNQDNLSPESQQKLSELQALAQQLDDIVPDAVNGSETATAEPAA